MFFLSHTEPLTLATLAPLLRGQDPVRLSPETAHRLADSEAHLPRRPPQPAAQPRAAGRPPAEDVPDANLSEAEQAHWETNLLRSHAYGTGCEVPPSLVRLMLLLVARHSLRQPAGLALPTVERLLAFYNRELLPVVYEQGGDSAALAHVVLPLLGKGAVNYQDYHLATPDALSLFSWEPLSLRAGEVGALRGGTPFTLAYAIDAVLRAQRLALAAAAVRALLGEATDGNAFEPAPLLVALRSVADAVDLALEHSSAESLAPALGQLAAVIAALGQASAGRTAWLSAAPGASGAATALATHNRAVGQSIAAETDPYAAVRVRQMVETAEQLLGMELLAAAQALELGPAASLGGPLGALLAMFRKAVPIGDPDQAPSPALRQAAAFVRDYAWTVL